MDTGRQSGRLKILEKEKRRDSQEPSGVDWGLIRFKKKFKQSMFANISSRVYD
jgi:hypothetical protein